MDGVRIWVLTSEVEAQRVIAVQPQQRLAIHHWLLPSPYHGDEFERVARLRDRDEASGTNRVRDLGVTGWNDPADGLVRAYVGNHVVVSTGGGLRPPLDPPQDRPPVEPFEPPAPVDPGDPVKIKETMWYELRLVDELGEPVEGVAISLSVSGSPRRLTTNGDGRLRVDDATTGFAVARISDMAPLQDALRPRWQEVRDAPWLDEVDDHSYVDCTDPLPTLSVKAERLHTIVVQPKVVCARLLQLLFETNKVFLLPSALVHIRSVRKLYERRANADVLIVGHTDATGEPSINDPLSLERAKSVKAYVTDDVDAWLAYYDSGVPASARWGSREDQLMLDAVLARSGEELTDTPVRHFQKTRGLEPDGKLGPNTRRVIVTEYMAADGTTLPAGIEPVVHGCGESFPLDEAEAGENPLDRRVELFFFDGDLGVLPPPPGEISKPDDPQYPEWRRRSVETHSFDVRGDTLDDHLSDLHFVLTTRAGGLPLSKMPIDVELPTGTETHETDDDGAMLLEAIPPGDYEVVVRLGEREDRLIVPSVPPGVEALLIPIDFSLGA